jgi:RNA polymerase sigma-70 factor (ECF subfamily)
VSVEPAVEPNVEPVEVLVASARAGDHAALSALLARHSGDITRLCRRLAGTALADDCAQDALILAMLHLPQLREPAAFPTWLRGIAIHVCHRARTRALAELSPTPPSSVPDPPAPDDFEASLTDALSTGDLAHVVRAAVQALPAGQRDAVTQFYLAGRPYEEAADTLRIPISALKTRLHKGRAALRHRLRLVDGPRPRRISDRILSLHESAHAVVHWAYGGSISRLAIRPRAGGWLGFCEMAGDSVPVGPPRVMLQVVMAGEACAAHALPDRLQPDSGDRANAARLARAATGGDDIEATLFIARALEAARDRLSDPATWTLVERVAEALAIRRALDADEFRALVTL